MLICRWLSRISITQKHVAVENSGKIGRYLFGAASISLERKLFGSNYDLRGFEKLQMLLNQLP
jgi:hypothetical protein